MKRSPALAALSRDHHHALEAARRLRRADAGISMLQPDPDLHEADVIGEYQRAVAAGDVDAAVAAFEWDGYMREPAGAAYIHRGTDGGDSGKLASARIYDDSDPPLNQHS